MYLWLILTFSVFLAWCAPPAGAQNTDLFEFFAQEAQVISASRIPQSADQAPATVYVITAEELRNSGAQTLWDALRLVPGVDVTTLRTYQGTVSIRGLSKALNNRTMVLVDGRSSMNVSVDYSSWDNLPVLRKDVERIEVVEGPASALYGANALNGVINIVTKKPEQLGGGLFSYGVGERQTHSAALLYGKQQGRLGFKLGLSGRRGNRFEDPDSLASQTLKGTGYLSYNLGPHTQLSLSGGQTWLDTQISAAWLNRVHTEGRVGFLRADGVHRNTRMRFFWNSADIDLNFYIYGRRTTEHNNVYDFTLEQLMPLSARSTVVVGAGYRNNILHSSYISTHSDLWSAFAEHRWRPAPRWALWTSARIDDKQDTSPAFSPRFSLVFTPVPAQTLRFSAGTAYLDPTALDRHLSYTNTVQVGNLAVSVLNASNPDLLSEHIKTTELAYQLETHRFKLMMVGFGYRLEHLIATAITPLGASDLEHLSVRIFPSNKEPLNAWGGEAGMEAPLSHGTTGFANYAYQDLSGAVDPQSTGQGTPHHKISAGFRFHSGGLAASASGYWVSRTLWLDNNPLAPTYQEVPGYALVDLHLGYDLRGRWQGLELALNASNLFDNRHFEVLPTTGQLTIGQSAEIVRARRTLDLVYRF